MVRQLQDQEVQPLAFIAWFAVARIRVDDGAMWGNNRHLPSDEAWLVGKWRAGGERKYYLSNLPAGTPLRVLATALKARWVCEGDHRSF
ncbi:hypothetical protein D9598_20240 [Roseomonas sp. KE0001]|nr:hypothetical protein [Roseomonas sp. KE0001]